MSFEVSLRKQSELNPPASYSKPGSHFHPKSCTFEIPCISKEVFKPIAFTGTGNNNYSVYK